MFAGSTDYTSASSSTTFTITAATPTIGVQPDVAAGCLPGLTLPRRPQQLTGVTAVTVGSLHRRSHRSCIRRRTTSGTVVVSRSPAPWVRIRSSAASTARRPTTRRPSSSTAFTVTQATPIGQRDRRRRGLHRLRRYPATATVTGVSGTAASLEGVAPMLTYYVGSTPSGNGSSTAPSTVGIVHGRGRVCREH